MIRSRFARPLALAAVPAFLLLTGSAQAATIAPTQPCYRYVPALAGERWVGVTGTGFVPGGDPTLEPIGLAYAVTGFTAGFTAVTPDGSFTNNFLMPVPFIDRGAGLVERYTITATDTTDPALTASTERRGTWSIYFTHGPRLKRRAAWVRYDVNIS